LLAWLAEEYRGAERGVPPLGAQTSHHTPNARCVVLFVSVKELTVTEPDESTAAAPTRRRAPGADPAVRSFGQARTCAAEACGTRLSRYNPDRFCSVHRGWDRQVTTRRRRSDDDED
jgi:hypothetical protein